VISHINIPIIIEVYSSWITEGIRPCMPWSVSPITLLSANGRLPKDDINHTVIAFWVPDPKNPVVFDIHDPKITLGGL
jgi:hypothetical protein